MSEDIDHINELLTQVQRRTEPTGAHVSNTVKMRMLGNIMRRARSASAPAGTHTIAADDVGWEPFAEGITRKVLVADPGDGMETALYRLDPGSKFDTHSHTHQETCWVVEGDLLVGDHMVQAGEMHVAEVGCEHPEIVARTSAVLLIRSQVYVGPLTPT